jgi:hypothetical protein
MNFLLTPMYLNPLPDFMDVANRYVQGAAVSHAERGCILTRIQSRVSDRADGTALVRFQICSTGSGFNRLELFFLWLEQPSVESRVRLSDGAKLLGIGSRASLRSSALAHAKDLKDPDGIDATSKSAKFKKKERKIWVSCLNYKKLIVRDTNKTRCYWSDRSQVLCYLVMA